MLKHICATLLCAVALAHAQSASKTEPASLPPLRPPAAPLIVNNPYLSVWSGTDRLTDSWPKHWTGATMALCGMVHIDGKPYRWCGLSPSEVPALKQTAIHVTALATTYEFEGAGVKFEVNFVSPVFANDAASASFAGGVVYIGVRNTDKVEHAVSVYMDISGEWCTHSSDQQVNWSRVKAEGALLMSMGVADPKVLGRVGDFTRIDWGRVYVGAMDKNGANQLIASHDAARNGFARYGTLTGPDDLRMPRPANDAWPVMATVQNLGRVEVGGFAQAAFIIAYDDQRCVEYFERPLKAFWMSDGDTFEKAITAFCRDDAEFVKAVYAESNRVRAAAAKVGDEKYIRLAELAYRQTMAAHIIAADLDGTMLMFPKENTSNGCIGTVDVFFPSSPFFLWANPELLAAQVRPILQYASMKNRWKFPFAPHDLGVYPKANGQAYGGGEKTEVDQMPVEECGNMLILVDALAQARGKPGMELAEKYWPQLTLWARYLKDNGLDPANQLCTDDFAGHLARNANLSIKAIIGIGAYADLCAARGMKAEAAEWKAVAADYVKKWTDLAKDGDAKDATDHTVLAFGKPGTWSLKYNLIWDEILSLNLFPKSLRESEVKYYLSKMNKYGPPLDSRKAYTKLDFAAWAAALASDRADFETIMGRLYDFAHETPDRVGLSDWYQTTDGKTMGMHTRSVVGGVYARMLLDGAWREGKEGSAK